jgi:polysaccharide deacetylase family protein (PEP-CTERM system associated)
MNDRPVSVFSVDVEDWFHILDVPSAPKLDRWNELESRVEKSTHTLLDLFDRKNVKSTLFVLGWVAERFPELVKECARRGHEIASHGYAHELVFEIGQKRFEEDIKRGKGVLEGIAGQEVLGYRAPGFSLTADTPWFYESLVKAGFKYDSSLFPADRNHGGIANAEAMPHHVETESGSIMEFPISMASVLGKPMYFFGGGYLRFFPYQLIRSKARQVLRENRPVVYYLHPREVDPEHPKLPMSMKRRFMSYVNISTTIPKMERLFDEFEMKTFGELMLNYGKETVIKDV